ncbi:hypothetical protein IGI04_033193 [Brassica rapa subsp. trilocularis]|uniref:Uncharacterized protein n=1 Tax=Brassica rapa subsp. trilocularis TaxID=1813537 RepID=A0ABQ7L588_BRACM|nr:hypothetical protein IGI04_033193 [Brassica rapa subsp. trilocularis]
MKTNGLLRKLKLTKQNKHAKELEESLGILNRTEKRWQNLENTHYMHDKRDAKEHNFQMLQQQERAKFVDISKSFIEFQAKEMKTFMEEREKKMAEMNKRYFEEMLDLEREFDVFGAVHDKNGLTMQMTQTTVAFIKLVNRRKNITATARSGLKRHTDPSLLKTLTVQNKHLKCTFWGYYVLRVIKYFYLQKNVSQTSSGERLGDSQTCLVNTHDVASADIKKHVENRLKNLIL